MVRTIYIPKAMQHLDQLARMTAGMRRWGEMAEIRRLHGKVVDECGAMQLPSVSRNLGEAMNQIRRGDVLVPSYPRCIRLQSRLWGSIDLPRRFDPSRYVSNVDYVRCARDLSVRLCTFISQYKNFLPEHRGGSKYFLTDWRKSLYLLQLSQSERYLRQFEGLEGLDAYAERYFSEHRGNARSFAINHFSSEVFGTLGWHTAVTPEVLSAREHRSEANLEALHKRILTCMRAVHAEDPHCNFERFTEKLLMRQNEWRPLVKEFDWSDPIKRFGREYRSWIARGIEREEIDRILEMHGIGYRGMQELFDEFVRLAEEERMSTEELSRIAVERGLLYAPLTAVVTQAGRNVLLDVFRDYGIATKRLNDALDQNAFWQAVRRIVMWDGFPPDSQPDLLRFVGARSDQHNSYVRKWLNECFRDPENTGPMYDHAYCVYNKYVTDTIEKGSAHRENMRRVQESGARKRKIVIQEGSAPVESDVLDPVSAQAVAKLNALEELVDEYEDHLSDNWYDSFVDDVERMRSRIQAGTKVDERVIFNFAGRLKQALGNALGDPNKAAKLVEDALS